MRRAGTTWLAVGFFGSLVSGTTPAQDTVRVRADGPPAWGPNVALVRDLVIGELDGPPEISFGHIFYGALEPSGAFYLYDANDYQIRRYDAQGKFTGLIGRRGGGPGEYQETAGIDVTGDTLLVVHDAGSLRITYFQPDGKVRRAFSITRGGFYGDGFVADAAGLIYVKVSLAGGPQEGPGARYQYLRYRPDGRLTDSVSVPSAATQTPVFGLSTSDGMRDNFGAQDISSPYHGGGVLSARSHAYRVAADDGRGRVMLIERSFQPVPLGSAERAEWEAWANYMTSRNASRPGGARRTYDIPRAKPAIRDLTSDHLGRIWVDVFVEAEKRDEPPRPPGDARPLLTWRERTTYDVFSPAGAYLGRIQLPAEAVLLDVWHDRLLLRTKGEAGEDRVAVYRMITPRH
jgi:hypothetical protein